MQYHGLYFVSYAIGVLIKVLCNWSTFLVIKLVPIIMLIILKNPEKAQKGQMADRNRKELRKDGKICEA